MSLGLLGRLTQAQPAPADEGRAGAPLYGHRTLTGPLGASVCGQGDLRLPCEGSFTGAFMGRGVGSHGLGSACSGHSRDTGLVAGGL